MTATFRLTELAAQTAPRAAFQLTEISASTAVQAAFRLTNLTAMMTASGSAPMVVAGADQEVSAGADVQLSCSAVPASGVTIASYVWRVVARSTGAPAATLSSTSVQSPTLAAPSTVGGATYTLGVKVVDSHGVTSAESMTHLTVDPGDFLYPNPDTGAWDLVGTDLQPTATGWA